MVADAHIDLSNEQLEEARQAADESTLVTAAMIGVLAGGRLGHVLLYARDEFASVVRPVRQLLSEGLVLAAATTTGTSSGLYARTGAIINLNADDVNGVANSGGLDFIILGDLGGPQTAILNTNTFNITTLRFDVGQRDVGLVGQIDGTGTARSTMDSLSLRMNFTWKV